MIKRFRRRAATGPDVHGPRLVMVSYITSAGLGVCRLRNPRWCYLDGRLAFIGERHPGEEIAFDFDQILALETVPPPLPAHTPVLALSYHG